MCVCVCVCECVYIYPKTLRNECDLCNLDFL